MFHRLHVNENKEKKPAALLQWRKHPFEILVYNSDGYKI